MENNRENLNVFGYGLALFISFITIMHELKLGLGVLPVLGLVIVMLWVLSQVNKMKVLYLASLIVLLAAGAKHSAVDPFKTSSWIALIVAVLFFVVTSSRAEILKPLFKIWMMIVKPIGQTISAIAFGIIFYCVFTPVAVILKIMGKDLLDQKCDYNKSSYWITKDEEVFDKKRCTKQF